LAVKRGACRIRIWGADGSVTCVCGVRCAGGLEQWERHRADNETAVRQAMRWRAERLNEKVVEVRVAVKAKKEAKRMRHAANVRGAWMAGERLAVRQVSDAEMEARARPAGSTARRTGRAEARARARAASSGAAGGGAAASSDWRTEEMEVIKQERAVTDSGSGERQRREKDREQRSSSTTAIEDTKGLGVAARPTTEERVSGSVAGRTRSRKRECERGDTDVAHRRQRRMVEGEEPERARPKYHDK